MDAATAEYQVPHRCQRQSALKIRKTLILEHWAERLTLYFDEHMHAKSRPSLK